MTVFIGLGKGTAVSEDNAIRFTLTLSEASANQIKVNYRTLLGTALDSDLDQGSAHSNNNGVVTFAPGVTSIDIFIDTAADYVLDRDESMYLELFNPSFAAFAGGAPTLQSSGVFLDTDDGNNLAVFVGNPTIVEGDSGQKTALFEVRLSQPATGDLDLAYSTANGSATAGSDYTAKSGTLHFTAGQDVAFVSVNVLGDIASEASESFFLVVTPPDNTIGTAGAAGTAQILDDDSAKPVITLSRGHAVEEDQWLRFTLTLSEASANDIKVSYRTLLGTALDSDLGQSSSHSNNNDMVTIAAGQTSVDVYIDTAADYVLDRDESVYLELYNPSGAVFAGGAPTLQASGVILDTDDDNNLAVFVGNPTIVEGDSGQKTALFEVRLSRPATGDLDLAYSTANGSATAGSDYTAKSGTLHFEAGQDTAFVSVNVKGDAASEASEAFFLVVTPPDNTIGTAGAVGKALIVDDDDAKPVITLSGGHAVQEDQWVRFTLTLSEASANEIKVSYRTLLGTALDSDLGQSSVHSNNNGVVTFAPGQTSIDIYIDTAADYVLDRDESFSLELYNPFQAVFAGGVPTLQAIGVILDTDDGNNLAVFVGDPKIVEGDSGKKVALFEVRLSQPATEDLDFAYKTADGSATAGSDYTAKSGVVHFEAGQDTAYVSVDVRGDGLSEASEFFSLVLTPPDSTIDTAGAVGTALILDNDSSKPVITLAGGHSVEEDGYARFTLTLSKASASEISVSYRTLLGTALDADLNFSSTHSTNNGVVIFAPGITSASVYIDTRHDNLDERDESIFLELFQPSQAVFAGGAPTLQRVAFILDNDGGSALQNVALAATPMTVTEGDGVVTAEVIVRLSRPLAETTKFKVTTTGQTAKGADFQLVDKSVTFAAGQTEAAVTVNIKADHASEVSETFLLNFAAAPGTSFPPGAIPSVTVTIRPGGLYGDDAANTIDGGGKDNSIFGRGGADKLAGLGGRDTMDGGAGADTADYSERAKKVEVVLDRANEVTVRVGGIAEDTIKNIEHVTGGSAGDTLTGDSLANFLTGNGGDDTLSGRGGDDTLVGGAGKDRLDGGGDADSFRFKTALGSSNVDTIVKFEHDIDKIELDDAIFAAIGSSLTSGEFFTAAGANAAQDLNDRIIYNTSNGRLYYDADGLGGVAAIHFATLANKPATLDHGDFDIV